MNRIIFSEILDSETNKIFSFKINNEINKYYLVEQFFHKNHDCDYLKESVIIVDNLLNGTLIVSPIIKINNNLLIISEDEYEIRNVNNKYYKYSDNEYGPELKLHHIDINYLYNEENAKRTYVENSYYIEKDGKIVIDANLKYDGPCEFDIMQ